MGAIRTGFVVSMIGPGMRRMLSLPCLAITMTVPRVSGRIASFPTRGHVSDQWRCGRGGCVTSEIEKKELEPTNIHE